MNKNQVFGAYDIRGLLGEEINEHFAYQLGQAFGMYLLPDSKGRYLIGHDARPGSLSLASSCADGLLELGFEVVSIGLASTPLAYWWGAYNNFDGSIVVTASHLPLEYSGFKLCRQMAVPLSLESGLKDIAEIISNNSWPQTTHNGKFTIQDALPVYASLLRTYLKPASYLKIAVDAGNGAGGPEVQAIFNDQAKLDILSISIEPTGYCQHRSSNPLDPGALDKLSQLVVQEGCAFGVAFDGDADRAIFVDEQGQMVPPDVLIALIGTRLACAQPKSKILFDLRARRTVPEALSAASAIPLRTRVGHSYIHAAMLETRAIFAGELSGHYYYKDLYGTDNALRTLIEMINLVSAQPVPLSALVQPFLNQLTSGELNLKVQDPAVVLQKLQEAFQDYKQDYLDGLSVESSQWWFNIRSSQTEPLLRLTVNATQSEILEEQLKQVLSIIDL